MMLQDNPFGQMPSFGGGMAGPGGFAGGMPGFGLGMFGRSMQDDDEEKKRKGINLGPFGMMSIPGMLLSSGHPNMALGMISPLAGGLRALGLFK